MKFEKYGTWIESALYLKEQLSEQMYLQEQATNENKKITEEREVVFKNYFDYYKNYDIPEDLVKRYLKQV